MFFFFSMKDYIILIYSCDRCQSQHRNRAWYFKIPQIMVINNNWLWVLCLPQSKEEGRGDGQMVKLSKLNGVKKIEDEGERREMITPALREALTKQGKEKKTFAFSKKSNLWIGELAWARTKLETKMRRTSVWSKTDTASVAGRNLRIPDLYVKNVQPVPKEHLRGVTGGCR